MLGVILVTAIALALAGAVYLGLERLGAAGVALAVLRAAGIAALALLLINPARLRRGPTAPPTVLLDASLSLGSAGGRWAEAQDSARALAGGSGVVLRFGARVAALDTLPPEDGSTRLADALQQAEGRPGPVIVVTDGEVEDAATLERSLLAATRVVLLPRQSRPDAALLELAVPEQLARDDSLSFDLTIGTFGPLDARQGRLEVALDGRVIARRDVDLPPAPGTARRRVTLKLPSVTAGARLLSVRLVAPGDAEPRDDARLRWIQVAAEPRVVVLAAPADWESRFLVRELLDIAPGAVRGYALIQPGRWVDMRTLAPEPAAQVEQAAAGASVVIGDAGPASLTRVHARWRWLPSDSTLATLAGDWYVSPSVQPSPLASRLSAVTWDSLPPLLGVVPTQTAEGRWIALSVRLARRGAERPLVLGWDSAGVKTVTVAGDGLWRWALRGGAAREAYRSIVAGGLDWLLGSNAAAGRATLVASAVVARGTPVAFRFTGDSIPDSLVVTVAGENAPREITLRFDPEGDALVWLPPGAYRWTARDAGGATGQLVVEEYSDEFPPRAVTVSQSGGALRGALAASYARQRPWLFALVILALVTEWTWRHRRGLP